MTLDERKAIKAMVTEILILSPTAQTYLARLWARGSLSRSFLERENSFMGKKFLRKNRGSKRNLRLLIRIVNEFAKVAYMDKYIEDYMESLYAGNMDLTPKVVAWKVFYYKRFNRKMMPWLIYLARKVKLKLRARLKKNGQERKSRS